MKFDDIYIWNKRKEITIYSVFEDKNYTIKSIENIYDFLNRNLGTKKKILLIKNTYSIPNSKEINEINFNYSLGCIYKNDFNLLKYSLNALVLNFSKISNSLFDNTPVNMLEAISEETNGTMNVVELEKFVKSNTIFKELSSGIIENKKIDINITPYYTNLKLKYTKEINELKSSNNRVRNLLLKELTNVNKQIDSLLKKKIRNKEMFNRKSLIELKISRLSTNFNRMKQRIDQKYSFILTDMDKYVKNIDTLMEKENLKLEKIINQENENILKNEKILNEENENKQKQIEKEKLQMAERKRKEKELLQKKAAEAKKDYLQKLAEKKKLLLEQKKRKEEAARVVMERNHHKKEEERKRKEELLRKQKEAVERENRELEAKKRELYEKQKEKEEEAKRLAIEKQKKLEKDRIEKEKLNKIKLQRAEKLKVLREKRKLELVELDKAKKRKLYDMVMNNSIVLGDTSIENFQKNNTHVNMKCIFQKNVNPNNNTCKNIFNKKKGNKIDDFKTLEDVAELMTTIIALEKGIALNKQYFMIIKDNVIFNDDFEKKFIDLKFPSDYNIVRIVDDNINTFKLSDDTYSDCVIYKTSYVKNYLLKFCKKLVGVFNYTLNKIPKSYVIGNGLLRYEQNKFVMIVPSYNNSKWYLKNLDSVVNQTYKNWRIVYVDDCSTDNTYNLVKEYIKNKNIENKVTLIRNKSNMKQAYSRYIAFKECMDDEICCLLDGDDWLYDNNVLNKLNKVYNTNDCLVTYSNYCRFIKGKIVNNKSSVKEYSNTIKNNSMYRYTNWLCSHMRTGYARLFKDVKEEEMKDHNGDWLKCSTDMAIMYSVMEKSKGKIKAINETMYVYNIDNSIQYDSSYYVKNAKFQEYRKEVNRNLKYSNNDQKYFIKYLEKNKISIIKISNSLDKFSRIKNMYNLSEYNNTSQPCLFFGVYNMNDLKYIINHKGPKYLMFGGTDCDDRIDIHKNILNKLKDCNDITFISISDNISERLKKYNIKYNLINLDLTNYSIFKPSANLGNCIYIYDGSGKITPQKNLIYNHEIINKVKKILPSYEYIHSSMINVPYNEMPNIYSKCFIGLRLTKNDGNANTVMEFKAMNIPIIHNNSKYGLEWKNVDDIVNHIRKKKYFTSNNFSCINIENVKDYNELISNSNGDYINESNFLKNIQSKNITLYYNNKFISGNRNLKPEITVTRNKEYNQIINKNNLFGSLIPYRKEFDGLYFITESMIEAVQNKNSLLYPHVFDKKLYNELNKKKFFLQEQKVNKDWYTWIPDNEVKKLKLKYFSKDSFIICLCGRIAINNYPKSLLEAVKILRNKGYNIQLLILSKLEVNPYRLTQDLYDEITNFKWVKSFTVNKKDILNYFRFCDILASTYRDYCNHLGGSNKIKEYLFCDKPILCSRGKERERELGKNYKGFYDCETCNIVPPLNWTKEFLNNPKCYKKQYEKYFKNKYFKKEINQITDYISSFLTIDLESLLTKLNIKNVVICPGLKAFSRISKCYNLTTDYDTNKPTLFFGVYSLNDSNIINNHKGLKYIMFGGNDCNLNSEHRIKMFKSIDFNKNVSFISISSDVYDRLYKIKRKYNLSNTIYRSDLNLIDKTIWKKMNILENNVYVYDGCMKKTEVYSCDICDKVVNILTNKYKNKINFIRTSDFKSFISQQELFKLYKKCFIGLRLTYHDGNANTVQEFKECNLPIIHNQSDYGIQWTDENDIVKTIEDEYKKNLVSVIVPTFNRIELLKETIDAILKQTYKIFEIIIINDCSTDQSFETYKKLEHLDDRITVYNLENNLGAAGLVRNYGIEKSNGTYIAFCDDDDLWIENKLEKQLLSLKNKNFDMCSTNAYKLENGKKTNNKLMPDFNKYPEELTLDFLLGVYPKGNIICTSSVLLKKSILKFKFSSKKYAEDYGLWLSILNDEKKVLFLNEPLLYYRIDGNNKQSNERTQKLKILIYQGINAYRCYKYTQLLSQMGHIVDCCHSYSDFSFHHGKDVLETKHINKLFKINNYNEYLNICKEYDILFCVDIIDSTPGNIHVGYNNFKNNIKTIYLIGDLYMFQRSSEHNYYKMEHNVLSNINPSLVVFSGKFLKDRTVNLINKIKYSSVILNTPLKEIIKVNKINNNSDKIKMVFSTNFTSVNNKHHRNLNNVFKLLTKDKRLELFVYYTKNSEIFIKDYTKQSNINFMGTLKLDKMIHKFSEFDIGILYFENIYQDSHYIDISEPNKLYEYYFAQLPIICNYSKSFNENIVKNNIGVSIELRNEKNLYSIASNLIKNYKHNTSVYSPFDCEQNKNIINTLIRNY